MSGANFVTANGFFDEWKTAIVENQSPIFYPVARSGPLVNFELSPGLITLIGGAPGAGKTAMLTQLTIDALRLNPELKAVVCNVEMRPQALLDRQLARLTAIPLEQVRKRRVEQDYVDRLQVGFDTIENIADRICFVQSPFDLENIAETFDEFCGSTENTLLTIDYIQRLATRGEASNLRTAINESMGTLRSFANVGVAVIVVSSLSRLKDSNGRSSYSSNAVNMASFKETSELEYGADNAYALCQTGTSGRAVNLKHLKSRYGSKNDIRLSFNGSLQRFEAPNASRPALGGSP